ncbi:MAG TPA: YbhB/YbcL family Raf kinase inhibitor-like protein [Negativicutes bacterium]|nr:YbhB/YbcL family Raf kinase inhibitor-like protein [Negativicutes bacterium]
MKSRVALVLISVVIIAACVYVFFSKDSLEQIPATLQVKSDAFANDGAIPAKYTGRGQDVSPPLAIANLSPGAKSIAIIMEDRTMNGFIHWLAWNIPVNMASIPEGVPKEKKVAALGGALQGTNSLGQIGYNGPAPMMGTNQYNISVYAIDKMLSIEPGVDARTLRTAMRGHVLQYGALIGDFGD